jgi:hypothetical protein
MTRTNLTRASQQLFQRSPDERFASLQALTDFCRQQKLQGRDRWQLPQSIKPLVSQGQVALQLGTDGAFLMNDWSFSQLCRLGGVAKDTVNRLSPDTACRVLEETLPIGSKPTQVLAEGEVLRSVHGVNYERLWNMDLLSVIHEYAVDFSPPPKGFNGATGLYAGEQDLFAFLIDPNGWAEVDGEAFAPGFFVWNSEVGRRTLGIQTFWFQQICQNHIVWDAIEVVDFSWKHTTSVHKGLTEIRRIIEALVSKREQRRDGFIRVLKNAMTARLGEDAEEAIKALIKNGIPMGLGRTAVELVQERGERFTVFTLIDALTRLAQKQDNAGDRTEIDVKAGSLLALAV